MKNISRPLGPLAVFIWLLAEFSEGRWSGICLRLLRKIPGWEKIAFGGEEHMVVEEKDLEVIRREFQHEIKLKIELC
jgi:hypothetical protein